MAVHAMWIRKNMLQSPASDQSHCERKMSENELRVLRSIQKLSIPDWYLNSSSRPPKILSNNTPIDRRPPSWKNSPAKKSTANGRAVARAQASTASRDNAPKIEASSIDKQSSGTYRIKRVSPTNEPENSRRQDFQPEIQSVDAIASKTKNMNVSQTFPRTSPSRKIQNINIVFPPSPEKSPSKEKRLLITDLDETEESIMDMTVDSLNAVSTRKTTDQHRRARVYQDEIFEVDPCAIKILQTGDYEKKDEIVAIADNDKRRSSSGTSGAPFYVVTDIDATPGKENLTPMPIASFPICVTPDNGRNRERIPKKLFPAPLSSPNSKCREKDRRVSSPSSIGAFTTSSAEKTKKQIPISTPVNSKTPSPTILKRMPVPPIVVRKSVATSNREKKCHSCELESVSKQTLTALPRGSMSFRKKSSLPPILEKSSDPAPPPPCSTIRSDSSGECFFNSNGKSLELERIVRRKQRSISQKSFVGEIIEALNERCKIPSRTTYVSPYSKNFVKKLVEELETSVELFSDCTNDRRVDSRGNFDNPKMDNDYNDDYEEDDDDVFVDSENGSEDDINSVAISTSISCKGTESSSSSDTDLGSPTIKHDYDPYGWTINANENDPVNTDYSSLQTRNKNHRDTKDLPIVDDENDNWLYWNQKTEWNLPRTSSLLSVLSKKSSHCVGHRSPCISPIDCSNEPGKLDVSRRSSNNNWGTIYRTKESGNSYKLCRLSETTILDSGYSDRSRGSSRSSSRIDNNNLIWFDCTDGTRNPSGIGSFCRDSWTKNSISTSRKLNTTSPIVGRPFAI